jgi:hypothetical protein
MGETPFVEMFATKGSNEIREPFSRAGLSVEWYSRAIGDIAKDGGLNELEYADIRTVSALGGLWRRTIVRVYGKAS